jgi:hypothetical protein
MKKYLNFLQGEKETILEQHRSAIKKQLLSEQSAQIIQGVGSDNWEYKKENGKYYTRKKGSTTWIDSTGKPFEKDIREKIFKDLGTTKKTPDNTTSNVQVKQQDNVVVKPTEQKTTKKNYCPTITSQSTNLEDLISIQIKYAYNYDNINEDMNNYAEKFLAQGIPNRISCQLGLNKLRPFYKDKNTIIVDSLSKLIYVYDFYGKFVGKTAMISGSDKQSTDPKVIANALLSWEEQVNKLGFKWVDGKGYVDKTGKNRKYDPELVYSAADTGGERFFPSGVYKTAKKTETKKGYMGGEKNMLHLFKGNKEISVAIHGLFPEQSRIQAIALAKKLLSTNKNDPKVSKQFLDAVSAGKINLSQSYGCINVPDDFVPILDKYMTDAYVFNMSESGENYLVDNAKNFFDKSMDSPFCPSPQSLGAKSLVDITA